MYGQSILDSGPVRLLFVRAISTRLALSRAWKDTTGGDL